MAFSESLLPLPNTSSFTPYTDSSYAQTILSKKGAILVCDSDKPFLDLVAGECEEMGIPHYRSPTREQLIRTLAKINFDCIWLAGSSSEIEQALPVCVSEGANKSALVLLLDPGQEIVIKFPLPTKTPLCVIEKPRQSKKISALLERTFVAQQQHRNAEQYLTLHYEVIDGLMPAEREVLLAICDGLLNKQMAKQLCVSVRTIEQRRQRLFQQMGVSSAGPLGYRAGLAEAFRKMTGRRRSPRDVG